MRINRAAAVAVAVATAALTTAIGSSAAVAAPPAASEAHLLGVVSYDAADPHVGYVHARYRCNYDTPHLWVSVKQNDARTADPALDSEGSGGFGQATTWLDSHRFAVDCDGKWHTDKFVVDQLEPNWNGGGVKPGALADGEAWVQFCLTGGNEDEGYSAKEFQHVRAS